MQQIHHHNSAQPCHANPPSALKRPEQEAAGGECARKKVRFEGDQDRFEPSPSPGIMPPSSSAQQRVLACLCKPEPRPTVGMDAFASEMRGILATHDRVLLHGPSGSGKTLALTNALADSRRKRVYQVGAADLGAKWPGESAAFVKELLADARKHSPCAIVLEDADQSLGKRDPASGGDAKNSAAVMSALLQELDGSSAGVTVLLSTTEPWMLDEAVLRRFSKKVCMPRLAAKHGTSNKPARGPGYDKHEGWQRERAEGKL